MNSSRRCGAAGGGSSTRPRIRARPGTCFSTWVISCNTGVCLPGFSAPADSAGAVTSALGAAAGAAATTGADSLPPLGAAASVGRISRTGGSTLDGVATFASALTAAGTVSGATLATTAAGGAASTTATLTAAPAGRGGATAVVAAEEATVAAGRSTGGAATTSGTVSLRRRRMMPPLSRSSSTFLSI